MFLQNHIETDDQHTRFQQTGDNFSKAEHFIKIWQVRSYKDYTFVLTANYLQK